VPAADLSINSIENILSQAADSAVGSKILNLIGLGGNDLETQFEPIKAQVADIGDQVDLLLKSLDELARELTWARLGLQAHPAVMRIWSKFATLSALAFTDKSMATRLTTAILDLNQGVEVDLLSLHEVITGQSSLDPNQPSLVLNWVEKCKTLTDRSRIRPSITAYVTMLAQVQFKGVILLINAYLACNEPQRATAAMQLATQRLKQQQDLLLTVWP
jgi:hypothetical protein